MYQQILLFYRRNANKGRRQTKLETVINPGDGVDLGAVSG